MNDAGVQLPALHRGIAVLEVVASARQSLGFSQLTEALGGSLPPSTLSRLLAALVHAGLLVQDGERRYAAGPRLRGLGRLLTAVSPPLADVVTPELRRLAEETGESAACFRGIDGGAELIAKHEVDERFRYMAVGGVNRNCDRHAFARLLHWQGEVPVVLVNRDDDQPGLMRIAACAVSGVAVGITCLAAGCDAQRERSLSATITACATRIAQLLEKA
jgi:DNA-binding transcriptional ArsR family regulator